MQDENRHYVLRGMFTDQNRLFMAIHSRTIEPSHFIFALCKIIEILRTVFGIIVIIIIIILCVSTFYVELPRI